MAKPRKTNIEKRRRLSELYSDGGEVRFNKNGVVGEENPETDLDVIIWVQPPDPLQREEAVRAGQAARARALLAVKDITTDQGLEAHGFVDELTREQVTDYIINGESRDFRSRAIRDVLADKEWEDFTALQDSLREWEELGEPEGPDWDALLKRDKEYGEAVRTRVQEILDDTREGLKLLEEEELRKRARKQYADAMGNQAFMQAYEVNMLFFSCRDDEDHDLLFFEDTQELQRQPEFVQIALANKLSEYIKDPAEAKNSPRVVPSSPQSEPPAAQETSEASTPEEQTG